MVLNIYKELVDELDLCAMATEFVGSDEHRLRLFGSFTFKNSSSISYLLLDPR